MAITHAAVILALAALTSWNAVRAEELPPYLKVCTHKEPDLSGCIKRAIEGMRQVFMEGDPSRGVPSLEPLDVGDLLVADRATNSGGGLRVSATNIIAHGASNFQMQKTRADFNDISFYFEVLLPHLETTGNYGVEGNILLLPIKGKGPFKGNFTDCIGKAVLTGEVVKKDGDTYMKFTDLKLKIKVGKGRLHLENLFGGDKTLGDIINQTINSNFDVLSKDIIPLIEKALGKLFLRIANQMVERYTLDQLYPEQ